MERLDIVIEEILSSKRTDKSLIESCIKSLLKDGWDREYLFRKFGTEVNLQDMRWKESKKLVFSLLEPSKFYVYKLITEGKVTYVGSTINIGNRLKQHHVSDKNFDELYVAEVKDKETMLKVEHFLIREHDPVDNKTINLNCARSFKGELPTFYNIIGFSPTLVKAFVYRDFDIIKKCEKGVFRASTGKATWLYKPLYNTYRKPLPESIIIFKD